LVIGHGPGAPTCPAAEIVHPVGMHLHIILTALLGDPSGFFKIGASHDLLTLAAIITGIVYCCQFLMDGFVNLDPSCLYVFFQ
jgi:hypothetical protein